MPLTTKQLEYLALAWQCFESEPKIDYNKFHIVAKLASPASARELLRVAKKKLREEYGAFESGEATPTSSKRGSAKSPQTGGKKRKGRGEVLEQDYEDEEAQAQKRKKTKSSGVVKTEIVEGEDGEEYEYGGNRAGELV